MTEEHSDGSMRTALANALVTAMKQHYGRGPEAAKAWVLDDYVLIVMEGGLTRSEETLLEDGKEDLVRVYRLAFQESIRTITMRAVSEITGRRVLDYHSQITFHPVRAIEFFILESAVP